MTKKQNFIFVYLLMNTIMCLAMSLAGLLVNVGFVTLPLYLKTLAQSLVVCNVCNVVFRISLLGEKISLLLSGHRPGSRAFGIWSSIVNATLNSFFMNTFMTLWNVGFRAEYFPAWWHAFPIMELVSVVVSLIAAPPAMKLARRVK